NPRHPNIVKIFISTQVRSSIIPCDGQKADYLLRPSASPSLNTSINLPVIVLFDVIAVNLPLVSSDKFVLFHFDLNAAQGGGRKGRVGWRWKWRRVHFAYPQSGPCIHQSKIK
ncbi:MAG TPA: hypothetical protein VIF60_21190, partial [Burkholderiaceae bacterium]